MQKKHLIIICAVAILTISIVGITVGLVFGLKDSTVVQIPQVGKIKGTKEKVGDSEMFVYYNVPYAVPPVGNLRFQPPHICGKDDCWKGTYDASKATKVQCIQRDTGKGTEDCLKLSIRTSNLTASKPVIVWIHGGGLMRGWNGEPGYSFDSEITASIDVVTVNINYRLGYLGFGAFEEFWNATSGVYANNGFRDMSTALTWIKNSIASFGGNADSVTLVGESGGGTAILGLISSPLANNLFHKAVSLSPAPEFRFDYKKGNIMQRFVVQGLGCTQDTITDRRKCLLETPANKFSATHLQPLNYVGSAYFDFPERSLSHLTEYTEYVGLAFTDPTVFPENSRNLKDAEFMPKSKIKIIISNTAQETGVMAFFADHYKFPSQDKLNSTLQTYFKNITSDPDILDKTYKMYPGKSSQMIWDTLTTDLRSTCPTNDVVQAMSDSHNREIYRLYITNSMANAPYPSFHGWDTIALFGFKMDTTSYVPGPSDIKFSGALRTMLKNLAHYDRVQDGWSTFPSSTMVLGNTSPAGKVVKAIPQAEQCAELTNLDLVKYGWQN